MTVNSDINKIVYSGNGIATEFTIPFYFIRNADLTVSVSNGTAITVWVLGTDYTLSGAGSEAGGTLTAAVAVPTGTQLAIQRIVAYKQELDIPENSIFPSQNMERALDRLTMQTQQLADSVSRSVTVGVFSDADPSALVDKIEVLYADKDNMDAVADSIADVNALADITDVLATLNTNLTALTTNATHIDDISALAEISDKLEALYADLSSLTTNATNIQSIITAANGINDIITAAAHAQDLEDCADNIAAIVDAPAQAVAAATSAILAEQSETNAAQSAFLAAGYAERTRSEGIAMSVIERKRIQKDGQTVKLWWQDPRDTIIDGFVISSWAFTRIVKKSGAYPSDIDDGVIVGDYTARDGHLDDALTDINTDDSEWFYRAFPCSVNGVFSLDKRNQFGTWFYEYYIDENDPVEATAVHYTDGSDNVFYEKAYMDFENGVFEWGDWKDAPFLPRPCMLKNDGTVDYYLCQTDYTKKEDGTTASDVTNTSYAGNAMMEWSPVYHKCRRERNRLYVSFSNVKVDDTYECFSAKTSDSYLEHFYTPCYEGNIISGKMRSMSTGVGAQSGLTADAEASNAEANGAGWTTTVWADEDLITKLFVLMFKRLNAQVALGNGNINGGASSASFVVVGSMNQRGMFWGSNATTDGVKVFGMENWWGNRWRRPNGVLLINGVYHVKMTQTSADGSTTTGYNRTGTGYINTGLTTADTYTAAYISKVHAGKYGFLVAKATGSSSTHYCDGHWSVLSGTTMLLRGGVCNYGALVGAFAFAVTETPSSALWSFGASLSYKNS